MPLPDHFEMGLETDRNCLMCVHLDIYDTEKYGKIFFCTKAHARIPASCEDEAEVSTCDDYYIDNEAQTQ